MMLAAFGVDVWLLYADDQLFQSKWLPMWQIQSSGAIRDSPALDDWGRGLT